jgi:hypothetical protein
MCKMWVGSRRANVYQSNSILWMLCEPLTRLSVIELKVLQDDLCGSYYDVEGNCKNSLFEEL